VKIVADYPTKVRPLSWRTLVAAELGLGQLEQEIQATRRAQTQHPKRRFCANREWYGYRHPEHGFKRRLCYLVGWGRRGGLDWLRSSAAYDVAYRHLDGLLPDCQECACLPSGLRW
jgi:hypothetical protein